ncbi:GNAT family N-acetyltransferase [Carboxylicivirga sp. M1479]|uniref:GNAT family N-acetyltransferase n=1 Tax=Carboxylicivirga sp. M1479 TaxID=2594476 RepID=UPI001177BA88|nr:GNAT family N-acetyltransferase [Carboxylicivirga sp. M1479]TRX65823.1 GNAT family N-acetyltransferase [Carboxylicivirga sp. M1479]
MHTKITRFSDLSLKDLYQLLQLRAEIFVVEQNCVYNDIDGLDEQAHHLIVTEDDHVIAYTRILPANTRFETASIGRLVVHKNYRFKGLAREVMQQAGEWAFKQWQSESLKISAQKYLKAFYLSLGYKIISDEYLEDGIPHYTMELPKGDE